MVKVRKAMLVLLGVMFLCALVPIATVVVAQAQVMELRYASPYAPAHPYSVADQKWIEKIEKETNGKVKIKPYWNGTLISSRESMTEVSKGVADIAFVTPIYEKSGVDLTKAILDFFCDSDPAVNAKIYWELFNKFPEIRKEYDRVKILGVNVGIPMYLMTSKKPVKTLDDLKGMRIRITGNAMMRTLKTLGAEPVGMPVVEMLESMQKGIIQGVIFAHGDYKSQLQELVQSGPGTMPAYSIAREEGPDHDKIFWVRLNVMDIEVEGMGKSRKTAEQDAARKALHLIVSR